MPEINEDEDNELDQPRLDPEVEKLRKKKIIAQLAGVQVKDVNDENLAAITAAKRGAEVTQAAGQDPSQVDPVTLQQRGGGDPSTDPKELDKQKKIGMALLAAAPTILGAFLGGNRGGAIGAQVGAQYSQQYGQDIEAEKQAGLQRQAMGLKSAEMERKAALEAAREERLQRQAQAELGIQRAGLGLKAKALAQAEEKSKIEKEPKPSQFTAATYALRVQQAENDLKNISKQYDPTSISYAMQSGEYFPEALRGSEAKQLKQAERNFVNAILRKESGAAISASEFANAERQYFPRVGDTPEVLMQKAVNRQSALAGLIAEAGPAYSRVTQTQQQMGKPVVEQMGAQARQPELKDRASKINFLLGR